MTVTIVKKRKPGRPPSGPYEDKRKTLSTRITAGLRECLEEAAEATGRSLSQEIEFRLEQSFLRETAQYEAFGGEHVDALMRVLGNAVRLIEATGGKKWQEDRETFTRVKVVTEKLLDALGPAGGAYTDGKQRKIADDISKTFVSEFVKKEG